MLNSYWKIELELIQRLINDHWILYLTSTYLDKIRFEFLNNGSNIGSISELDQFSTDELYQFLNNTYNIHKTVTNESEKFLGELLYPKNLNLILLAKILDLLVKYYKA